MRAPDDGLGANDHRPLTAPEAEISVLGAILIDPAALERACTIVSDADFTTERNRLLFRTCVRQCATGAATDPASVAEALSLTGELEAAGGLAYIGELLYAVPTAANVEHHARIVAERATRRALIRDLTRGVDLPSALAAAQGRVRRAGDRGALRLLDDSEIAQLPKPEFLIDDVLPLLALAVLFGPPGAGKSFLALAMALSIATGRRLLGHSVRQGPVVFVAPEGAQGIGARVAAWKAHHGYSGTAGVYFVPATVSLLEPAAVQSLIEQVRPLNPVAVFFDTLARSLPGGDENSALDMGRAIAAADTIRTELGATVVPIHHTNAGGERERGSTALRGAADAMLSVQPQDGRIVTVTCEKMKDSPPFAPFDFALLPVGDSAVIGAVGEAAVTADFMTPNQHRALRSLRTGFLEEGATATQWMEASGIPARRFYEARTWLVNMGYVRPDKRGKGAHYTLTDRGAQAISADSAGNCGVGARSDPDWCVRSGTLLESRSNRTNRSDGGIAA